MIEYLILISCVFFLIFLIPTRYRQYAAIVGWTGMVLFLFAEIPYYLSINNFLYPLLAVLSVPFLDYYRSVATQIRTPRNAAFNGCRCSIPDICAV